MTAFTQILIDDRLTRGEIITSYELSPKDTTGEMTLGIALNHANMPAANDEHYN